MLRINLNDERNKKLTGKIINLVSNDASNLDMSLTFAYTLFLYPIMIVACIYIMVYKIGFEILLAMPLVLLCSISSMFMGKLNVNYK